MRRWIETRTLWASGFAFLLACAAGCGGERSHQDYLPPEDRAREALEKALTAWQNGQRPGTIKSESLTVSVVDSKWQAGQKLKGYQILRSEPGDGPTWFSVRLSLRDPPGEQQARYVVVGPKGHLWVYREEDYSRITGMDHAPKGKHP